jgi:hypothetical protein
MVIGLPEWMSFWDIANPRQGARALDEMYGEAAAAAAANCAEAARADDRDEDYRFWIAVLARLQANDQPPPDEPKGRLLEDAESRPGGKA